MDGEKTQVILQFYSNDERAQSALAGLAYALIATEVNIGDNASS
jgi:hypothetical protein